MRFYECGTEHERTILLLAGTCCTVKSNFSKVVPLLQKHFHVIGVDYDGFDDKGTTFTTMLDEVTKIEKFIQHTRNGKIDIVYGSSLGGSIAGLLVERGNLEIRHVILGSSDLDQSPNFQAHLKTSAVVNLMFPVLKTGKLPDILSKMVLKKYGEENLKLLSAMFATISTGMGNVTKTSVKNQFYSDLITPLADQISPENTFIHVFYATKMGEKYEKRYLQHFANPDIIRQDYGHEELLFFYPEKWVSEILRCCGTD
ncbi:MAG: alpha/beta fold hydrolase [Oscillospiraceae bacterium]